MTNDLLEPTMKTKLISLLVLCTSLHAADRTLIFADDEDIFYRPGTIKRIVEFKRHSTDRRGSRHRDQHQHGGEAGGRWQWCRIRRIGHLLLGARSTASASSGSRNMSRTDELSAPSTVSYANASVVSSTSAATGN